MKIAINGRALIKPYTGLSMVSKNLLKEMSLAYPDINFLLYISEKTQEDYSEFFAKNVSVIKVKEFKFLGKGFAKLIFEQITLPKLFKKEKVDIALYPYPSNPFIKPKFLSCVVVHDAISWKYKSYSKSIFSKINKVFTKLCVKKADIIFTVSKYSKKEISKYLSIAEELIKVVYNDAGDVYKEELSEDFSNEIMKKLKIKKNNYFIYAGGYDERKNVNKLIAEFQSFSGKYPDIELVLVGDKVFEDKLYESFEDAKNRDNIVFTGFVTEKELCALYKNAISLLHLSKDEGFNLPILEASNANCPIIISDIPVHREIAGKDAVFVDLAKNGEASLKMEEMLDKDKQISQKEVAKKIAGNYLWERSALRYMNIMINTLKNDR